MSRFPITWTRSRSIAPKIFHFPTALGSSLNIPAVKLLHDAGVEEFIAFINRLRQEIANTEPDLVHQESQTFNAHNLGLSVGLGTYELSPMEFASLWKVFLTS